MKEFWNERYSQEAYVYGTEPNEFFKLQLDRLKPGRILLPAEGEGRNAVYAARNGWEVVAFDISEEGKKKALKLADSNSVEIEYIISEFGDIDLPENSFDCVSLIYAHNASPQREDYHKKVIDLLKPNGTVILEAFNKKQIENNSGGPQNLDLLFSKEEIERDFKTLSTKEVEETDIVMDEGMYHQGYSSVIRLFGMK